MRAERRLLVWECLRAGRDKTEFKFDDLGEKSLKNIGRPVHLYAARGEGQNVQAISIAPIS